MSEAGHSATSQVELPGWRHVYSGKVRDLYVPRDQPHESQDIQDPRVMLVVASNRVSAFDHVLEPDIPGKGAMLTALTNWWFSQLSDIPNHLVTDGQLQELGSDVPPIPQQVTDRATLVWSLRMVPIECVVRAFLTGSGYHEYMATGAVCGVPLPSGLRDGDRLPEPIFTPAFKAEVGQHDENITFDRAVELVGADVATQLRDRSLEVFTRASALAEDHGLLLADTKFEFGFHPVTGQLTLGDEVLTSDSSRYWDAERYEAGGPSRMHSFDKQALRDWLAAHWDRTGEPPVLPDAIVRDTSDRYRQLLIRLGVIS